MLLLTFDIDFIRFVLGPHLVKPFYKIKTRLTSNEPFKWKGKKERLRRIRELVIVLVVDLIYNLIIDR